MKNVLLAAILIVVVIAACRDRDDKGADALPLDTLGPIQLPARVRPESPVWITAAKALYGFEGATLDQQAIKTLAEREQDTLHQKGMNFPDWAFDRAWVGR